MHKVSCVVAAYNESPRIGKVLSAIQANSLINEIIVVDDASVDDTAEVAAGFGQVKLIKHAINKGKSVAVHSGISAASGDIIILLDADLEGLTSDNISSLIEPVLSGRAEISISMRKNSPWIDRMLGIDYISGERVFFKKLIENHLPELLKLPKFGLEVFFNKIIIKNKCRIKVVFWKNVSSTPKSRKTNLWSGIKSDIRMISDILGVISVFEVAYQFFQMRRLMVD